MCRRSWNRTCLHPACSRIFDNRFRHVRCGQTSLRRRCRCGRFVRPFADHAVTVWSSFCHSGYHLSLKNPSGFLGVNRLSSAWDFSMFTRLSTQHNTTPCRVYPGRIAVFIKKVAIKPTQSAAIKEQSLPQNSNQAL